MINWFNQNIHCCVLPCGPGPISGRLQNPRSELETSAVRHLSNLQTHTTQSACLVASAVTRECGLTLLVLEHLNEGTCVLILLPLGSDRLACWTLRLCTHNTLQYKLHLIYSQANLAYHFASATYSICMRVGGLSLFITGICYICLTNLQRYGHQKWARQCL